MSDHRAGVSLGNFRRVFTIANLAIKVPRLRRIRRCDAVQPLGA